VSRNVWRCRLWISIVFVAGLAVDAAAQTRELVDAPHVDAQLRVRWDPATRTVVYAADSDRSFRPLPSKGILVATKPVTVTYPQINPLREQTTLSLAGGDEPAAPSAIVTLLRAILAAALTTAPTPLPASLPERSLTTGSDSTQACPEIAAASQDVARLARVLYGDTTSPTVGHAVRDWREAVDAAFRAGRSGPEAIGRSQAL